MLRSALTAGFALLCAPAAGGWQGTEWGMSPNEVSQTASNADRLGIGADFSFMGYDFLVTFEYQGDQGLRAVRLTKISKGECGFLRMMLGDIYDPPVSEDIWHDNVNGNYVRFEMPLPDQTFCTITYSRGYIRNAPGSL